MKGETNGNHKRKGRPLRPGDPCEKIQQPASIRIPHRKYLITYAGKSLGEKISRNRHGLDADGNPLPDPSGDTINNEEAQG